MNIEEAIEILKMWNKAEELVINESTDYDKTVYIQRKQAIETLLTAYEKEKEKNMELTNSYNQAIKETNEENRRCMLLAVENQDLKEKNKRLRKCHLQYEEMTGIDLLLPEKEE